MTRKMGYLLDLENPYITLDNDYIETVWWLLDQFFKQGLMYEGTKSCLTVPVRHRPGFPRGGPGLQGNQVRHRHRHLPAQDAEEYFLVWTTTP